MPLTKEEVRAKLTEMGIKFEVMEHGPVYTIDEMKLTGASATSSSSSTKRRAPTSRRYAPR